MNGQSLCESRDSFDGQQKYILVAEDDEAIKQFVLLVLEQETSYTPLWAVTAHDALRIVREYTPVLFLFDYHLPSMTGLQLYDQLHAIPRLKTIPVILMSASFPKAELQRRGIFGLDKPFDLDELLLLIERVVHGEA